MKAAQSRALPADSNQIDGLAGRREGHRGRCGGGSGLLHKSQQTGQQDRETSMVNEDDILLVSGGFSMDASQNSLAEHVAQVVDGSDQPDDCSQLDDSLDPRFRGGKGAHANGNARPHPQHAHLCAQGDPANDTEPVSNQPFVPSLPHSSLQAHAQPFAPPTPYGPESLSQTMNHSRPNSYGSTSVVVGQPNEGPGGNNAGMQRMGSSQITEAVNAGATATASNAQVPFGTIDENLPTGSGVGGDSGADTGLSFSGGLGGAHARVASIGGGLSARDASLSFGNLAIEPHNQPERDYSTELLLRDAMYPATHNGMFPSLKLPELSMDGANSAYAPVQPGTDLSWSNSAMQAQAQSHQMAGLMQAGQLGGQMAGYSTLPPGAAGQFAPGINSGADSGVLDYAESSGAAGGSSFFERQYPAHQRQEGALRGWHTNSTPAMLGMEGGYNGGGGAAISPRHLQTGPAWDQMPGVWRNDGGFHGNPGTGFDGSTPPMMPQGAISGSFPNMLDNVDTGGNFSREGGAGIHSGNPNIWLRGGSHPQLSTLGRGSGSGGYGSSMGGVGSMPKGGGGSFGGDLWKQRTNSAISLSQLQRATAAATGATSAAAAYAAAGSGSGSSGSRAPSEHPLGEYPSRTLFTRNINIHTTDEELLTIFSQCGEVRSMYTSCKHRGFVMISYYDIRASTRAKQVLQGFMLRQRALDIHYSVPKENAAEPDLNQGTLVVFNMDSSIPRNQILDLFSQFGEVKEIRATPKKEGHKFVEFYDSRHAHAALQGLNRVIVAGRQLKIELSRPGGVRRARNSQQNLVALHSENSSSQQDLLAASSMGSGNQPDNVPLGHSLPNTLGHGIGALVGGSSSVGGATSNGGANGISANGAMPASNGGSLQGSTELQAMFQNLMLQAANPNAQGGHQGQQSSQGGFGCGPSGPGGDSFQTPPDTPAAEGSMPDASAAGGSSVGTQAAQMSGSRSASGQGGTGMSGVGNMSSGNGQMGSEPGMLSQQQQQAGASQTGGMGIAAPRSNPHSNAPSVAHSPAGGNLDESYAAACRAWGSAVNTGNQPGAGAGTSYGGMQPFVPGRSSSEQAPGTSHQGMAPGGPGQGGMHLPPGLLQHQLPPQNVSPSDSATSLHSFYNALLRQFVANPGSANTSPEAMEGSYHSMLSELLQGSASNPAAADAAAAAAGFQQQPTVPFSGVPKPDQARSMHSTLPPSHTSAPGFHPSGQPMQLNTAGMEQPPQAGGHHPLQNSMNSNNQGSGGNGNGSEGTLPATLAAAAASAAAALARDPSIPPEEHESRLHQHLMEQLSNMHRHAVGQDLMMEQYKSQTTPPASPGPEHQLPPPHPVSPHGASSSYHHTPPHPPGSIGSPHRSPHSSLPHSPRGPLPASRGPHPLSMSQFTPSPPPAPPSVDSDLNSPGRGPGSIGSSSLRPMSPGGGLSLGGTNSHGRYGHGASTPRPISARHSRSPLAGGHSNASSLPASVAGSHNSVGEYLDGGSGSRRASHSGEHFILTPEAVGTGPGMDSRTTLMIRNIPNKYTQKILMQTIDAQGFYGKYDFFYLPIDFKNRCNVGYAFINMASTDAVRAIHEEFHNKGWERFNSEKRCCVAYARIQTRRALISHFQNSSLMHEDKRCRPVLLNLSGPSPEIEEFPPPRRASHSSHSRRGGARSSGRRESMDSQPHSHRGSEPPTAPGTGNNTPRKSQESLPVSGTAGRATG